MIEDEAKKKWCPYASARVVSIEIEPGVLETSVWASEVSARGTKIPSTYCIGSDCMMWRWDGQNSLGGHCGLAGNP